MYVIRWWLYKMMLPILVVVLWKSAQGLTSTRVRKYSINTDPKKMKRCRILDSLLGTTYLVQGLQFVFDCIGTPLSSKVMVTSILLTISTTIWNTAVRALPLTLFFCFLFVFLLLLRTIHNPNNCIITDLDLFQVLMNRSRIYFWTKARSFIHKKRKYDNFKCNIYDIQK